MWICDMGKGSLVDTDLNGEALRAAGNYRENGKKRGQPVSYFGQK